MHGDDRRSDRGHELTLDLHHWVNEGRMTPFFLVAIAIFYSQSMNIAMARSIRRIARVDGSAETGRRTSRRRLHHWHQVVGDHA